MKIQNPFLMILLSALLCSCSGVNQDNANTFNSITQSQQAQYWQAQKIQDNIHHITDLGMTVYVQGDEYEIVIPSSLLFKNNTPQTLPSMNLRMKAISDLINAQSTPLVQVLAYSSNSNSFEVNFALTQSQGQSVVDALRQQGLDVGVLAAQGHGDCDNIGKDNHFTNRIEIHYRISHGN